ncbi:MAG: hypothetical protein LBV79_11320 [Candidatus Adiutrix sp.]|jgi:hypothetical protein|nr:hypothetical protein [Candidatus Adiutrix sp.]
MIKIFNYILLLCLLILVMSGVMFVAAEYPARYWIFVENKEFLDNVAHSESFDPFRSDTRYSAVILSFHQNETPDTMGPKKTNMYYDFEGQGLAVKTGWAGPQAGLLVIDRGRGLQLLGYDGSSAPGLLWLETADANHNGRIDAQDPVWPTLKIWLDRNTDGLMDEGELSPLADLKITALNLAGDVKHDYLGNGNFLEFAGTFQYGDGQVGRLDEVFLRQHSAAVKFLRPLKRLYKTVPNVPGSGLMRHLREAAAAHPELEALAAAVVNAPNDEQRWARLDELMTAWAKTGGLAETAEERLSQNQSGKHYTLVDDGLGDPEGPEMARRMNVLEAWAGRYFFLMPHELNSVQELADLVVLYNEETGEISFNYAPVREEIDNIYQRVTAEVFKSFFPKSEAVRPGLEEPAAAE